MGRTPLTRLVTVATGVREALQSLVRRMAPPPVSVLELASGFMTTQLLYAVARLGVADVLGVRSLPADEVAAELGTSPDATYRLLRACAAAGILREDSAHRFSTTPLGDQLRSGPGSVRPVVLMLGDPGYQAVWGRLPQSVTTGTPAAGAVFGRSMWEQLDEDREFGTVFDEAMTRLTELDWPAIAAAHDFTGVGMVVDVGGGRGPAALPRPGCGAGRQGGPARTRGGGGAGTRAPAVRGGPGPLPRRGRVVLRVGPVRR